jgi:hypothetical protein
VSDEARIEVTILRQRVVTTHPGLEETFHTAIVTYQTAEIPSATVNVPLSEVFKAETEDFLAQLERKKGPLYSKYIQLRADKIRADLKRRREEVPETIRI